MLKPRNLFRNRKTDELVERQSFSLRNINRLTARRERKAQGEAYGTAILFIHWTTSQEQGIKYMADSTGNVRSNLMTIVIADRSYLAAQPCTSEYTRKSEKYQPEVECTYLIHSSGAHADCSKMNRADDRGSMIYMPGNS